MCHHVRHSIDSNIYLLWGFTTNTKIYESFTNHYTSVSFGQIVTWNITKEKKGGNHDTSIVRDSEVMEIFQLQT